MTDNSNDPSYEVHAALHQLALAPNPLAALEVFKRNQALLNDWRFIYADDSENGPFKIHRECLEPRSIRSSLFQGKSLWVIDAQSAAADSTVRYVAGMGLLLDSNAASYVRSLAYKEEPTGDVLQGVRAIELAKDDYGNLNPFLYLWEAQRHYVSRPETEAACRQTVAAIHALQLVPGPLDADWGRRYRANYRDIAEEHAETVMAEFQLQLDQGLGESIRQQCGIVEAMLLRTKIIDASSRKSPSHKLQELVRFMDEDLSTIMVRELIVCADILFREPRSTLSRKLNSLEQQKDPLERITNCAWDMFLFRAMDALTNAEVQGQCDFYVANMISCDRDIADIFAITELKGMALHRNSSRTFPFFNTNVVQELGTRLGDRRMSEVADVFSDGAFALRAGRRSAASIESVLAFDRTRLLALLKL